MEISKNVPVHISISTTEKNHQQRIVGDKNLIQGRMNFEINQKENGQQDTVNTKSSSSTISIISASVEDGSVPIYRVILVTFILLMISCLVAHIGVFNQNLFTWIILRRRATQLPILLISTICTLRVWDLQ